MYSSSVNDDKETRFVHATQAQGLFDRVIAGADAKGMKLNQQKTVLLCVSAARSYKPLTYLKTDDGVIVSGNRLKLLGFHFDNVPSAGAHVKSILQKVRYRTWIIYHLRRLGMSPAGLLNVYSVLIRPCFDYSCVVYNSMLTRSQSEALERQQRKIFKVIYGWDVSYELALARSGLDRLDIRRVKLVEKFSLKMANNPRYAEWFPLNEGGPYDLRQCKKYKEFPFRTERLRRAPLYSFRRILNSLAEEENP